VGEGGRGMEVGGVGGSRQVRFWAAVGGSVGSFVMGRGRLARQVVW